MMTTSVVIFPVLLVGSKFKEGLLLIAKSVGLTIGLTIIMGRINLLFHFFEYLDKVMKFTKPNMSYIEKFYSCLDLLASSLFVLPFNINKNGMFWWISIGQKFNWIGFIILIICAIGYVYNYRNAAFKIFAYWILFMFALFIILSWDPHSSPLFVIYFSWAIIPLFVAGLKKIIKKPYFRISLITLIFVCCISNIYHIISILKYFVTV
jgi:hypothetical protein